MTVLITGGAGFIGLNIVEALIERGESVVIFDRMAPLALARAELSSHGTELAIEVGNICDPDAVRRVVRDRRSRRIIHAAAVTSDPNREAREPQLIFDVNVGGTLNVLTAAQSAGCERFIYVGSGAAYGRTHDEGKTLHEDASPSQPVDLYGISKFSAERAALRLGNVCKLDVIAVRLGSVFGPWEFDTGVRDFLSPQFQVAGMAVRGEHAIVPPVQPWRDWVYSRDIAAALIALLTAPAPKHRCYHVTSGADWGGSFFAFCDALAAAYPNFSWRLARPGEEANVDFRAASDRSPMSIERLGHDIGFHAGFTPREAYADYLEWIGKHPDFFLTPSTLDAFSC
jgi:nucleoside-diphosphate-sugar epimerase